MNKQLIIFTFVLLLLSACSDWGKKSTIGPAQPRDRIVEQQDPLAERYHTQIKPILENRCVVCHGCYDAPCQLLLSSP